MMPVVLPNDDGIRPAGGANACCYCQQPIGAPHGDECVVVTRRWKVRYSYEIEIDMPASWDKDMIEFSRNDSSWCADNSIGDIQKFTEEHHADGGCLCNEFNCEALEIIDDTPRNHEAPKGPAE